MERNRFSTAIKQQRHRPRNERYLGSTHEEPRPLDEGFKRKRGGGQQRVISVECGDFKSLGVKSDVCSLLLINHFAVIVSKSDFL